MFTGTARVAQQAREEAASALLQAEQDQKKRQSEMKTKTLHAQIAALQAEAQTAAAESRLAAAQHSAALATLTQNARNMARLRGAEKATKRKK